MKLRYLNLLCILFHLGLILNSHFLNASPILRNSIHPKPKLSLIRLKVDQVQRKNKDKQVLMVPYPKNAVLFQMFTKLEKASRHFRKIPCLGFKKDAAWFVLDSSLIFEEDLNYAKIMQTIEAGRFYDIRLKTCKNKLLRVNSFSVPVPLRKGTIVSYHLSLVHSSSESTPIPVPLSIRPGIFVKTSFYFSANYCKEVLT